MPLTPSDRALGDLLVGRRILTLPQLDEATALAETWNVRLGDAILSRNWIEPAAYYQGIAYYMDCCARTLKKLNRNPEAVQYEAQAKQMREKVQ